MTGQAGTPTERVYVIGNPNSGVVKIGRSVDITRRLATIQTACPFKVEVLWHIEGGTNLEGRLHAEFRSLRAFGEWFDFGTHDPVKAVREAVDRLRPASDTVAMTTQEVAAMLGALRRAREEGEEAIKATPGAIVDALKAGKTAAEIARHLGISESYVRGVRRENGLQDQRYAHLKPPRASEG